MTAAPQEYTVHCLVNATCECARVNRQFNYYMFMEGSRPPSEEAVQYCNGQPSLSCSEELDNSDATNVDNQLTVTWDPKTVITEGDYHTTSTPANGDHDILCDVRYFPTGNFNNQMKSEEAFVSIRGIYSFLMHTNPKN